MAYISITANKDEGSTTLQERVLSSDLESELFCTHLVERLRWAVEDTQEREPTVPIYHLQESHGARKGGSAMEPKQSPFSNEVSVLTAWGPQ
jgi:hypothetical protein